MTIYAAADGSALGNPGPAGWGWYVDEEHWACGGWPHGTNNMGELKAVLDLIEQTAGSGQDLHVYCDSQYVINSVTKWMAGWKSNGWRKKDKSPVLNVELMQALDAALTAARQEGRSVDFEWVKGHAGHVMNEEADRLAQAAAAAFRDGDTPDPGPGWTPGETPPARPDAALQVELPADEPAPAGAVDHPDAPAPSPQDRQAAVTEVTDLEKGLPTLTASGLEGLLHPQMTRVTAAGRVQTREQVLTAGRGRTRPVVEVIEVVDLGPDALLVRSTQSMGGRQAICSSVWLRVEGAWRQRLQHYTSAG